jgi:hypothetical protein
VALALGNASLYEETTATLRALAASGELLRADNERLKSVASKANQTSSISEPKSSDDRTQPETFVESGTTAAEPPVAPTPDLQAPVASSPPDPLEPSRHSDLEIFAELFAEGSTSGEASHNGGPVLGKSYRLLVTMIDPLRQTDFQWQGPVASHVRARLTESLKSHAWCHASTDQDGYVVALVETDLADPTAVIGEVLDTLADSTLSVRAALAPACVAPEQYRSSYATCRQTLSFLAKAGGPRVVEIWKTSTHMQPHPGRSSRPG